MESKINNVDNRLNSQYVAVEFNGGEKKLLNTYESVETSYPGSDYTSVEARYLTSGELSANESQTYTIKLWMDESVTVEDDAMNKSFISKVVVTAKQSHKVELADLVQLGDYVEMTPTSTSYTISKSLTGYSQDQTINPSELNLWRVISINEDGTIEMVSEYTSSTVVYLTGKTGYKNLVLTLQTIAEQYAKEEYTINTRHFGYNGQTNVVSSEYTSTCGTGWGSAINKESLGCGDRWYQKDYDLVNNAVGSRAAVPVGNNETAAYWLPSRDRWQSAGTSIVSVWSLSIDSAGEFFSPGWGNYNWFDSSGSGYTPTVQSLGYHVRPIVTLKADILRKSGNGTEENPYRISINE